MSDCQGLGGEAKDKQVEDRGDLGKETTLYIAMVHGVLHLMY